MASRGKTYAEDHFLMEAQMGKQRFLVIAACVLLTVASASAVTSGAQAKAKIPKCTRSYLTVTVQSSPGAGGHSIALLHFKNHKARTCHISGYPGVALLTASGKQKFQATRTRSGYAGGVESGKIPHITLKHGNEATAVIESVSHRQPGGTDCPGYHSALITAPNLVHSVHRSLTLYTCTAPSVHPLVAGSSGSTA